MKKSSTSPLLTVRKDVATKFHLSIPQTLRFNNFNFCGNLNLKCDRNSSNMPSLFLEIPLQAFRIQLCMYGIPELKRFLRLYSQFENKKSKNANLFARVAFLSALLSYSFSFQAKILFVIRCIYAFQSLNSFHKHFLGYNLENWIKGNESCNITQIVIKKNSNKIFLVKRWDFWTCSLITKGGERKSTPTVKNLKFEESCFVPNAFLV